MPFSLTAVVIIPSDINKQPQQALKSSLLWSFCISGFRLLKIDRLVGRSIFGPKRTYLTSGGMGKGAGMGAGKGLGVEDLSPWLRKFGSKPSGHLRELTGKKVAVDVSRTLHAALRSHAAANQCHATPPVEITAIIPYLRGLIDIYEKFGVTPIMVFDGIYHPGKQRIDSERASQAAEAVRHTSTTPTKVP